MDNSIVEQVETAAAATGISDQDRRVAARLARHAADEAEIIESYRWLLEQPLPPAVPYLIQLILEDEERHHRLLAEMARSLAWGPLAHKHDDAIPPLYLRGDESVTTLTDSFLEVERNDRAEMKRLANDLHRIAGMSPLGLLAELMILDTEKHIRILEFIRRLNRRSR